MRFALLGPLVAFDGEHQLPLGGPKQRSVLALLLLSANQHVSTTDLVDGLWGDEPPDRANATVQVYVSNLRKVLPPAAGGAPVIETVPGGYRLNTDTADLDISRFAHLAALGRAALQAADHRGAVLLLDQALALCRGTPGEDLHGDRVALAATRLEEERLAAVEDRFEAKLRLGEDDGVIGELPPLIGRYPYRERLRAMLMIGLYQRGRQVEALQVYRDARALLVDELGIDPGPELQQLERSILEQAPTLWPVVPAPDAAPRPRWAATEAVTNVRRIGAGATSATLVQPDGTSHVLGGQPVTIGRSSSCSIPIADGDISRRHAVIRPVGDRFVVADLGSTNGTIVNGAPVAEHTLEPGDVIDVAGHLLEFRTDE